MNGNDLFQPAVIWIVIGLVLLICEFVLPGLVIGFFGAGAILVGLICWLTDLSLNMQIVAFLVGSVGMILFLRNVVSLALPGGESEAESEDAMDIVGEHATVIQAITPDVHGRVEFHGSQWDATAVQTIPQGTTVSVVGRDNLTLFVQPLHRS